MTDERLLFLSYEWLKRYVEELNSNEAYAKSAATWEGDFIFRIDPDGEILHDPVLAYVDLWHGRAREARPAAPGEEAAFTYSSSLENWKKLVGGEIGPIRGIVSRKFKLKGNIVKVMRYMKAAQLLVDTVGKVPTKFHDE